MSLNKGLAAALKSARAVRRLSQQDLGDTAAPRYIWMLEDGKSSPTLNKLEMLSVALQLDLTTLVALSIAARDKVPVAQVLERVKAEITTFEEMGGLSMLEEHSQGNPSTKRGEMLKKLVAVQECKRQGLTQKATVENLGIPRSTVHDLWKMETPEKS